MIRLLEFPDTNFFYYDEPIQTVPDFIAFSDNESAILTYQIEWWYEGNPSGSTIESGQNKLFTSVPQNIDYRCIITETIGEEVNIYYSDDILSYYHHIKKLPAEVNSFYVGDPEYYKYVGYVNYDNFTGVENKSSFKENGISAYLGYSGYFLPVLSMMDSYTNRNQKGFDDSFFQLNLNPQTDSEEDTLNIFDKYNLDVNCLDDQELFSKIQQYEHENFVNYTQKSAWLRILKPIDDGLLKLYNKIKNAKIIEGVVAGENLLKHQLVTLINKEVEGGKIFKAYKANPYSIKIGDITKPRRAFGFVLENTLVGNECEVQVKDRIDNFNFWWNPSFDFTDSLGEIYYLYDSGQMLNSNYPVARIDIGLEDWERPVFFQEIGYPVAADAFMIKLKLPVIRHILTGTGNGGGPV